MSYDPYSYIGMPFNESVATSIYWVNSELIVLLLIINTMILALICGMFGFLFIKGRL